MSVSAPATLPPIPLRKAGARISALDGLRAVSILFVIFGHAAGNSAFPQSLRFLMAYANFGVRVFFVISGFLITSLLLKEQEVRGSISLKKFYLRRVFRIFPASYTFLAVVALLAAAGWIQLKHHDMLAAATYWMNFHSDRSWWLGHLWSLSVEEQFYLLWPAVLAFGGWKFGWKAAVAVVLFISPLSRIVIWNYFNSHVWLNTDSFMTVADALACGCLLAGTCRELERSAMYARVMNGWTCTLVGASALTAAALSPAHPRWDAYLLVPWMNIAITLCIHWCLTHKDSIFVRTLDLRPIAMIGVLSYSLYLWQQLFLNYKIDGLIKNPYLGLVLSFAAAGASYLIIEKPFLRIKDRYFHG